MHEIPFTMCSPKKKGGKVKISTGTELHVEADHCGYIMY